jgi:hypothetical protein
MPETTQTNAQAPQQQQGGWFATISRMLMMYMIFNFFRGKSSAPQTDPTGKVLPPFINAWKPGEKFVIITWSITFTGFMCLCVRI